MLYTWVPTAKLFKENLSAFPPLPTPGCIKINTQKPFHLLYRGRSEEIYRLQAWHIPERQSFQTGNKFPERTDS